MKDSQGCLVFGRTRWRRFALVVLPAGVLAGGLLAGVANGAVPVAFNVSGQTFKVSATSLDGGKFAQYSGYIEKDSTKIPVVVTAIDDATIVDLCQSVRDPAFGITLIIRAGSSGSPVSAHHLLIGTDALTGDVEFTNVGIGQDASTVPTWSKGGDGDFGQQADHIRITNLKQRAYTTHAGTFKLNGLRLKLSVPMSDSPAEECFADSAIS